MLENTPDNKIQAQGLLVDLALHTLGWKAFQDLCAQIFEEVLKMPVSIYREAQDGGQDAVFLFDKENGVAKRGTVQCKFTSDAKRRLRPSDLTGEIDSIKALVESGDADTYYFITNMGIDAPVAISIRNELQSLGVKTPQVFGKEWITLKIRESSRLRALVPRIYGLGDLSAILDERRADQTRALLGHLIPSLKAYVPTTAHRESVRIIKEHGILLLLGSPATGKSMIASILATTTLDEGNHRCYYVDSPNELLEQWNPNESGGFYWIDDAFGPNQLRDNYVDQWISMMSKVKTAISGGNRFVLTSRSHIWHAAKTKLGTRNHPLLHNRDAIVQVGTLSPEERSQILYNHIKVGNQTKEWKTKIKPFLGQLSENANLLPEIARRLGDSNYTRKINSFPDDINRFVAEPMDFLKETVEELTSAQQAGLVLVFLYRSRLPSDISSGELSKIVSDKYCVGMVDIGDALQQLDGTFVVKRVDSNMAVWSFIHPTVSDALSSLLGSRPDLADLYLRGAKIETILSDTVCAGMPPIQDAVVIGESSNDLLISRLLEIEDDISLNTKLFAFLNERASEAVFINILSQEDSILKRKVRRSWTLKYNEDIKLYARAYKFRKLQSSIKADTASRLENAILENLDSGIFDDEDILALIQPKKLIEIIVQLIIQLEDTLPAKIEEVEEDADLDIEPEDNFDDISRFILDMEILLYAHSDACDCLNELSSKVKEAISRISDRKCDDGEEWDGEDIVPVQVTATSLSRSLFSDIDE